MVPTRALRASAAAGCSYLIFARAGDRRQVHRLISSMLTCVPSGTLSIPGNSRSDLVFGRTMIVPHDRTTQLNRVPGFAPIRARISAGTVVRPAAEMVDSGMALTFEPKPREQHARRHTLLSGHQRHARTRLIGALKQRGFL